MSTIFLSKSKNSILLIFLVVAAGLSCSREAIHPSSLDIEELDNSLGLSLNAFYFEWKTEGSLDTQSAYQILVASSPKVLAANIGDLWDTGKRFGAQQENIAYRGKAVQRGDQIYWKVRLWNQKDEAGPYSVIQRKTITAKASASNRIVLLGGTLIANMEKYGYFETAITSRWPNHDISFRNLAWPGDDVFGTARSQFGSAHNTKSWQPPEAEEGFGFEVLRKQIASAKPGSILISYGGEMAFAEKEEDFENFEEGYKKLLSMLDPTGATLILLTPPKQQAFDSLSPVPSLVNERLARVRNTIAQIATEQNYPFIDLYEDLLPEKQDLNLTHNGIQLTEKGHKVLAEVLLEKLGLEKQESSLLSFGADGTLIQTSNAGISNFEKTGRGARFSIKADQLHLFDTIQAKGKYLLRIDGKIYNQLKGEQILQDLPDSEQYEQLRQAIIEKNRLHRYRLNPLNSAYIFLFRQHEMGHLAYEMDDFERLVEEQEAWIDQLRQPRTHVYEVELYSAWEAPPRIPGS